MAGYSRQSVADIIANAIIKAAPVNAELNAIRDAFALSGGHRHDGSSTEGSYVPLIADSDAINKVVVDTLNNRISVFVEVGGSTVEQVRIQDGAIVPVVDNDIDLGAVGAEFKDIFINGVGYIDTVQVHENATIAGTLGVTGLSTLASVDVNAGTIDGTVIGAAVPQAVTGTNITATTGLFGALTGNVTGNLTGNSAGTHTGPVVGAVTGDVTSTGTSSFANVTISGSLDMNAGTSATVTGLSAPVNGTDAATKTYVDTADALKLNLAGGTMSGAVAMGNNKITGLGTPTATADAATKGYVDTSVSNLIAAAPAALDTLNELAAALGDDANFSTTVTNSLAAKLPLAGGTMTGDITLGANKATSTATPVTADTLTRKGYVDTQDALKLNLTGGTMSGAIAMGTNKVTGVGNPTAAQDAATKTYVDTADALKLNLSGGTMTGSIAMGANKVTSTATPTAAEDLTTKTYVDSILGSATASAASAAAALVSETAAAGSASAALTSEQNAAASYDAFDDRYLGAKASAPTLDNDGNTLLTGALYWNTTTSSLNIWTGTIWSPAVFDAAGALFSSDLGVTVQAYDASILKSADIGVTVQGYDATILKSTDIGVTVQAQSAILSGTTASYTTASETKLAGIEAGADVTDTANVTAAGAVMQTTPVGSATIPAGATIERDVSPAHGYFRFNLDTSSFEGYNGISWGSVGGGATGGGSDAVFIENDQTINTDYTVVSTKNAMTTGPIEVASGVTVTIETGARWVVI
jgi:uncharacterized protein YfiM (DUF2279 family)